MSLAGGPSTSVSHPSDPSQTIPYSVQEPLVSSVSDNAEDENGGATGTPVKSLFGPFPPSSDNDGPDHQSAPTSNIAHGSLLISAENIDTSTMNRSIDDEPAPTIKPRIPGPSEPIPMNKINNQSTATMPPLAREKTAPAIGPATDRPTPIPREADIEGPILYITLLLSSTGARHPYKLDEKYLRKRNVTVDGNNPINISLYKLKELILRDWRDEWEAKPSSPDSIRLIFMGKMLNDKAKLSDSGFTNGITPHIIHMTIKPQDIVDEEDAKMKATGTSHGDNERTPGCRCVIQ